MSQDHDVIAAACELKFDAESPHGTFSGLASVYGVRDSHDDVVLPGAFTDSLAERKAQGRRLPKMFLEHSAYLPGGSKMPCGKWDEMIDTPQGLWVKGHFIDLEHPDNRRAYACMREGELDALSIAFAIRPGGAVTGTKAGDPKRLLKAVDLFSVDLVGEPSNHMARIDMVKAAASVAGDQQAACTALTKAMQLHRQSMAGSNSPNAEQRAQMMAHLQDAHRALTGQMLPPGMKALAREDIGEFCHFLQAELGWSHSIASAVAEQGLKAILPRADRHGSAAANPDADREAIQSLRNSLAGFSLPSLKG